MVQAVDLVSGSSVANSTGYGASNTGEQEQKPENETSVAPAAVEADTTIGDNSAHWCHQLVQKHPNLPNSHSNH